ncbi:MAG TPA: RNA pseudouridine synthase [Myxococcota bacterium]|nr:RNA pseudouridine synthase [Myxococcota bacterium]
MFYKISEKLIDQEILDRLLYRDAMILVLNKPSGLPVHPANGNKHNLGHYLHLLRFGLPNTPELAHRLDLGTSGCLILARHAQAARRLGELFTAGLIKKTYYALVEGQLTDEAGRIDIPLSKQSPDKRHWWMKADINSTLKAITDFRVLERFNDYTLIELKPLTGRTHQLRVHCEALGVPIVGDYIYGKDKEKAKLTRLCLHASEIEIPLYPKREPLIVRAPLPTHMNELLKNAGNSQ